MKEKLFLRLRQSVTISCYFLYYPVQTSITCSNLSSKNYILARNEIKYKEINKVYNTGRAMLTPTKLVVKG